MKGQAKNLQEHKVLILKLLSVAGMLEVSQLTRMIDVKPDTLETILTQMRKADKLVRDGNRIAVSEKTMSDTSPSITAAMWVFADFIHRSEYFTAGEFPSVVCFFINGVEYEIIPIEPGQESIVNKASTSESPPNRIIVVSDISQVERLNISGVVAYCTVDESGKVQYYKGK